MVGNALVALLELFEGLRPAFTQPGFENALVVFVGWVLTNGTHAVTQALVATDVARRRHHEAYHRFFSRGTWRPDDLGLIIFDRISRLTPDGEPVRVAIDDTLVAKKGPEVFGIGSHLDAVRSTKSFRVFCFGHVWVTLAVVVKLPFSRRPWALPVLFRLYRNEKDCKAKGGAYRKKTELAREMLDVLAQWVEQQPVEVAMDSAYCNATVMTGLPPNIDVVGAMRPDAVLTAAPRRNGRSGRGGRPRLRGRALPKPEARARDARHPWSTLKLELYGRVHVVTYKMMQGQWYRACGDRLLSIVIVKMESGRMPLRIFFSTKPEATAQAILQAYAKRWAIEVCFRDMKQLFGFGDSSARKREAVERTAPFVGYIYSMLIIWFAEGVHGTALAAPPIRPWYPHKEGLCFADVLRAAQRVLAHLDVLDPARSLEDLQRSSTGSSKTRRGPTARAA